MARNRCLHHYTRHPSTAGVPLALLSSLSCRATWTFISPNSPSSIPRASHSMQPEKTVSHASKCRRCQCATPQMLNVWSRFEHFILVLHTLIAFVVTDKHPSSLNLPIREDTTRISARSCSITNDTPYFSLFLVTLIYPPILLEKLASVFDILTNLRFQAVRYLNCGLNLSIKKR